MKQTFRRYLAMFLSIAMVLTMLPASVAMADEATEGEPAGVVTTPTPTTSFDPTTSLDPTLVLHYDMSYADGKLTDISGHGLDGKLNGITDEDFSVDDDGNSVLNFDGSAKYVEIPAGALKDGSTEEFTIEATYTNTVKSAAWLYTLGTTVASWPNVTNYLFVAPNASDGDYNGKILAAIKDANSELRVTTKTLAGDVSGGKNIVTTVFDEGDVTYFVNGQASAVTESGFSIQSILTANSTDTAIGYIGKSLYSPDPYFNGSLIDFKIYKKAMTTDEVNDIHKELAQEKVVKGVKEKLLSTMLKDNVSANEVTSDLSFPATLDGVSLSWKSSDETVISATGELLYNNVEPKEVTIQVTGTYGGNIVIEESYVIKAMNADGAENLEFQAMTIPNADNIKGNITLPTKGQNGSDITWAVSENGKNIINVETSGNTPAGVVTRPEGNDVTVTLTATLKQQSGDKTKNIPVTVKAKAEVGEMTDYIFAYFIGDGAGQERIHFASSRDGLNWEELNGGEAVIESTLGTKGLRDPYICRSPEGDKFYMIATDLNIGSGTGWTAAQNAGSQAIMVWESDDLVNWSEQRMATVSAEIQAGCTWAPEFYYDDTTGEYIVFWASKVAPDYNKQRVYYCKTRDFYTFTEPRLWIEEDYSVIDTTVVKEDGVYYRFTKNENEGQKYIYIETADTLLGEWTRLSSPTLEAYNNTNGKAVEGPCCFRFNDDDIEGTGGYKWGLLLDNWTYFAIATKDLSEAVFDSLDAAKLPSRPRHGTIMNITADEYQKVMEAYGLPSVADDAIPAYVATGYNLPDKVMVSYAGNKIEVGVTWDKTAADFAQSGTVTVKGTLTGTDNDKIDGFEFTKTIEVMSNKLIYYIDSGVGSWNQNMPESNPYNTVSSIDGIALRNEVPDQTYSSENKWGIIGGDDIVGNRTSETVSIYSNGWWAKSGKDCEYVIPLENGTYSITGYFGEWWSVTRPMKFYAQYTNSENEVVKSEEKTLTISGSNSNATCTLQLEVKDVAEGETVDVHILSTKNESSNPDPVIAGLSVEKLSMTEEEQELNAAISAFAQVDVAQESYDLIVGASADIEIEYPADFEDKLTAAGCEFSVAYDSENNAITVDENGKIQAVAAGTANVIVTFTLTCDSQIVKTVSKTVTVNVTKSAQQLVDEAKAALEEITLAKSSYELIEGDTATITVNYPEGFTDKLTAAGLASSTTYSSGNDAVAKVDDDGNITAVAKGTAAITVTIILDDEDTTSKPLTVAVEVKEKSTGDGNQGGNTSGGDNQGGNTTGGDNQGGNTTGGDNQGGNTPGGDNQGGNTGDAAAPDTTPAAVKLSVTKAFSLGLGESTKLTATVTNKAGEVLKNQKITWTSSSKKVATVSSGKITAKKAGTTTITAKTSNGKTAKIKVTVKKKPTKITITTPKKKTVTLKKGKTLTIKTKITPSKAASYKLTYTSSKKKVASVSAKGVVKGLKKGTTTITVKTYNGKKASVKVTVK